MTTREFIAALKARKGLGTRIANFVSGHGYVTDPNKDSYRSPWFQRPDECEVNFAALIADLSTKDFINDPKYRVRNYGRSVDALLRKILNLPPRRSRFCCPHCGKSPYDKPTMLLP